ncbi:hypothetical protein JCM8097_003565 [Rhodosporidiobolus ruineniae]
MPNSTHSTTRHPSAPSSQASHPSSSSPHLLISLAAPASWSAQTAIPAYPAFSDRLNATSTWHPRPSQQPRARSNSSSSSSTTSSSQHPSFSPFSAAAASPTFSAFSSTIPSAATEGPHPNKHRRSSSDSSSAASSSKSTTSPSTSSAAPPKKRHRVKRTLPSSVSTSTSKGSKPKKRVSLNPATATGAAAEGKRALKKPAASAARKGGCGAL